MPPVSSHWNTAMNLIDLIPHPVAGSLQSLRRQPRAAVARRIDNRPRIECLESRIAPSNIFVAVAGHTLNVTGDSAGNQLTIQGDADPTLFHLSSAGGSINGLFFPFTTPTGITSISIKLLGGDDSVSFGNTVHIDLMGSLTIDGGDGANSVTTTDLKVEKNFSITNGTNIGGTDTNALTNLSVGGALTIKNGNGDSSTTIGRTAAGISTILGNLSITNGSGRDTNQIEDTNVGHNVTITNGHADFFMVAGLTKIYNAVNASSRSLIGGNVSVTYLDGNTAQYDGIWDTEILGNVTFNHGTGAFTTYFDGFKTSVPVVIRGNLTMKGTGGNDVTAGAHDMKTGLIVGKSLSITSGSGPDALIFNKLEVGGATKLLLGDGGNAATIDDSTFIGTFALTTGAGTDAVNLDTTAGTSSATIFEKPVVIKLGAGSDSVQLAGFDDANQSLIIYSSFVIHPGDGSFFPLQNPAKEFFPFGGGIVFAV